MKRLNRENSFVIIWVMCVLMLVGACNLGFLKGTWSGFGNVTGQLGPVYTMSYYSNYPDDVLIDVEERTETVAGRDYSIMVNVFAVSGYEFVNWNTSKDGSGDVYNPNDTISLQENLTFYAQWKKVEVVMLSYGDVNIDGVVNGDDFLLVEQFIVTGSGLMEQRLLNADVNADGKVDLVDVDIIKQVCLGTEGYVGILPNNPILIYEVYNGGINNGDEDVKPDDTEQNGDGNQSGEIVGDNNQTGNSSGVNNGGSSGTLSGNGSSTGSSSGGGTSTKPSSNKGNKPSFNNGSKPGSGGNSNNNQNVQEDVATKSDDVEEDNNELLDNDKNNGVVEEDNNKENNNLNNNINDNKNQRNMYSLIMVFVICLFAIRLIIYVIRRFNEKEKIDSD